jgi:hypothetical protein
MTPVTRIYEEAIEDTSGNQVYISDQAFICDACRRLNICTWTSIYPDEPEPPNADKSSLQPRTICWNPSPTTFEYFPDVPEAIASAATEATLCLSVGAYRAACSMSRSVIEATAKDKGHTTGRLIEKIESLKTDEAIRSNIASAAHEVRFLGNETAHGDFTDPVSKEEAEETIDLMKLFLHDVYQANALINKRKSARLAKSQ